MNVLSLFDGMGCAWISLKELGILVDKGYSSEIDKHCCKQIALNFPEVEQIGDVRQIDVSKLEKIDFLFGGSPCKDFSFAGTRRGMVTKTKEEITTLERYIELKEEGFAFEGQSYLFFEFLRILRDIRAYNPNVKFLLENVEVGKKWEYVFNENLGIHGVHINSALVSAQNRRRIYWTNIKTKTIGLYDDIYTDIPQPEDRGIFLRDILEAEVDEKYYVKSPKMLSFIQDKWRLDKKYTQINGGKALPALARQYSNWCGDYICVAMRGRKASLLTPKRNEYGKSIRKDYEAGKIAEKRKNIQQLEPREDGKTNCLTSVEKDNLLYSSQRIRRLTPTECSRLQTIPDWYRWTVSERQQYKMLSNGWTVEVIKHILSFAQWKKKS